MRPGLWAWVGTQHPGPVRFSSHQHDAAPARWCRPDCLAAERTLTVLSTLCLWEDVARPTRKAQGALPLTCMEVVLCGRFVSPPPPPFFIYSINNLLSVWTPGYLFVALGHNPMLLCSVYCSRAPAQPLGARSVSWFLCP